MTPAAANDLELLRGTLDLLVLKTLSWGPMHGLAVLQWIERSTRQRLQVEEGALYPALHRMEDKGWLDAEWGHTDVGRRAKFYRLTDRRPATAERRALEVGALLRGRRVADRREGSAVMSLRNWPGLRRVFRIPLGLRRVRADVNAELGFHIDGRIDELMSLGMSRAEAEVGGTTTLRRLRAHRVGSRTLRSRRTTPAHLGRSSRCASRRSALHHSIVGTTAGVRRRRHRDADARHCRDDRDLSRRRSRRAASASLSDPDRIVYLGWTWTRGGCSGALSPRKFTFWQQQSRVFDGLATSSSFRSDGRRGQFGRGRARYAHHCRLPARHRHAPTLGRGFSKDEFTLRRAAGRDSEPALWIEPVRRRSERDRSNHSARRAPVHGRWRDAGVVRGRRADRVGTGAPSARVHGRADERGW